LCKWPINQLQGKRKGKGAREGAGRNGVEKGGRVHTRWNIYRKPATPKQEEKVVIRNTSLSILYLGNPGGRRVWSYFPR
jgi:hypothetical protein